MTQFLIRLFIRQPDHAQDPKAVSYTHLPELAAQDPEAPPVQATEAEENSTNQHTPENSVVLTPEEIRAALDAGAMDAAEAQCIDLSDENGFFS